MFRTRTSSASSCKFRRFEISRDAPAQSAPRFDWPARRGSAPIGRRGEERSDWSPRARSAPIGRPDSTPHAAATRRFRYSFEAAFGCTADSQVFPREFAIVGARIFLTRPSAIGQHPRWYVTASRCRPRDRNPAIPGDARPRIFFSLGTRGGANRVDLARESSRSLVSSRSSATGYDVPS